MDQSYSLKEHRSHLLVLKEFVLLTEVSVGLHVLELGVVHSLNTLIMRILEGKVVKSVVSLRLSSIDVINGILDSQLDHGVNLALVHVKRV